MAIGKAARDVVIHIRGDNKDFQAALNQSDISMSSFASKLSSYGPMIAASFATGAAAFIAQSVKMAAAEEAVSRQTEALLRTQGTSWRLVREDLDKYMKQLERLTAYNDTDLQIAFNTMIAAGMTYTEALNSMNTVTSMAYSLNRDLNSMAMLVGKAYNGQTGELSRYGIVLDETLDKTEKFAALQDLVNEKFADASERSESVEGKMQSLKNQTSNFAEALGNELIPAVGGTIDAFTGVVGSASELGTTLGRILALPYEVPAGLYEVYQVSKEVESLRREGVDTQAEVIEKLGLQSDLLTQINDADFDRMMKILGQMGYIDKMHQLQNARNYGLQIEARTLQEISELEKTNLATLKEQTAEQEKQLSLMERFNAIQAASPTAARRRVGRASMSAETAAILGIKNANINPNISSSRSGV